MLRLRGARSGVLMQQIGRLFLNGTSIGSSEGELLDRFVKARDEAAFEALVARHGPMVLGVCRQLLRDPNDVDDAFQATFLVLVRKAATLRRCDLLGNWLYGVAYRVAMRARCQTARRMSRFAVQGPIDTLVLAEDLEGSDCGTAKLMELEQEPWLHQEVSHLPEKYRTPIVLCYFEGLTHDEAASRLGCPLGTVKGRLARARDLLRRRLTRRGVALTTGGLVSHLTASHAQAAVPAALEMATTRAALSLVSSASASLAWGASISIPVTALAEGVLHTMIWNQVRLTAASLVLAGTLATGVVVGATQFTGGGGDGGATLVDPQDAKGAGARGGAAPKTAGAAAGKSEKPISTDLASQISSTNRAFEQMLSRLRNPGTAEIDRLSRWSNLMLSADLVVATNEDEGVAARTANRDRMKSLQAAVKRLSASTKTYVVNEQHAGEKLREAEALLESGGNPEPGPSMMMGGMMGTVVPGGLGMMSRMMGGGGRGSSRFRPGMKGGGVAGAGGAVFGDGIVGQGSGSAGHAEGSASESGVSGGGAGAPAGAMGMPGGMGGGAGMVGRMGGMVGAIGAAPAGMGMGGMMSAQGGGMAGGGIGGRGLSLAMVTTATELAIRDKNPKSRLIHKKLEEPVSMSFNDETPLEDVLKYVKVATTTPKYGGIQIYVDPEVLKEAGITMATPIKNMELEGVRLKTTLRLLLKQLGLAYCVRDGVLIISSPQGIFEELREARQELNAAKEVGDDSIEGGAIEDEETPNAPEGKPVPAGATVEPQ